MCTSVCVCVCVYVSFCVNTWVLSKFSSNKSTSLGEMLLTDVSKIHTMSQVSDRSIREESLESNLINKMADCFFSPYCCGTDKCQRKRMPYSC